MAKTTGISWTRSTRNLWAGCTKVGPGCDGCYAEAFQRWVQGKDPETGEAKNWGPGRPRIPYLEGAFKDLRRWNTSAMIERGNNVQWRGRVGFWPVFINTQSDFFDNDAPQEWRDAAYQVFEECPFLTLFLVTKRVGNVPKMVPPHWLLNGFPSNVRLLITVVNRQEAERDIPKLLDLPCKNGISYEPAIEDVDWSGWMAKLYRDADGPKKGIEWLIVGGESAQAGHRARLFDIAWARGSIAAGRKFGVPVFVKQLGSDPRVRIGDTDALFPYAPRLKDEAGADPAEWPEDLRVQEFPQ